MKVEIQWKKGSLKIILVRKKLKSFTALDIFIKIIFEMKICEKFSFIKSVTEIDINVIEREKFPSKLINKFSSRSEITKKDLKIKSSKN